MSNFLGSAYYGRQRSSLKAHRLRRQDSFGRVRGARNGAVHSTKAGTN